MELGKKVAIFYWERGRNLAPRERQKIPWVKYGNSVERQHQSDRNNYGQRQANPVIQIKCIIPEGQQPA